MDPTAGRDNGAAGVDSPGAYAARGVRRPDGVDIDVAARSRKVRAGARSTKQPAGTSFVHHRHDRAAGKGSAGYRHRRAPDYRSPLGVGVLVWTSGRGSVVAGVVARAGLG